ncbi:unnamed protein product [Linum trigynum]|uniref:Uncharacterized protein n=1 Tax=Linum trigynum TaxID=586398 RepID=A0AAV2FZV2_9ROSI
MSLPYLSLPLAADLLASDVGLKAPFLRRFEEGRHFGVLVLVRRFEQGRHAGEMLVLDLSARRIGEVKEEEGAASIPFSLSSSNPSFMLLSRSRPYRYAAGATPPAMLD